MTWLISVAVVLGITVAVLLALFAVMVGIAWLFTQTGEAGARVFRVVFSVLALAALVAVAIFATRDVHGRLFP